MTLPRLKCEQHNRSLQCSRLQIRCVSDGERMVRKHEELTLYFFFLLCVDKEASSEPYQETDECFYGLVPNREAKNLWKEPGHSQCRDLKALGSRMEIALWRRKEAVYWWGRAAPCVAFYGISRLQIQTQGIYSHLLTVPLLRQFQHTNSILFPDILKVIS